RSCLSSSKGHVIERNAERSDQWDERLPTTPPALAPDLLRKQRFAMVIHQAFPIRSIGERFTTVYHLIGVQKPQLDQNHGDPKFRELPGPGKPIRHLVVAIPRYLPR